MLNDKKKITLIYLSLSSIILGIVVFTILATDHGNFKLGNFLGIFIVYLIVLFMVILGFRRIKDLKKGQPIEDELSKKTITLAAAKSFYISLYWLLAIMLFEPIFADLLFSSEKLQASQALGGGITGMTIIFLLTWIYYQKKGVN